MENVGKKVRELISWVRENGYPSERLPEIKDLNHYRLDDRFFTYDLYEVDNKELVVLIVGIQGDHEAKFALWGVVMIKDRISCFVSGEQIMKPGCRRRK